MLNNFVFEVVTSKENWSRPGVFRADFDLGCGVWREGVSCVLGSGVVLPGDVVRRRCRSVSWEDGGNCFLDVLGVGHRANSFLNDAKRGWWYRASLIDGSVYDADTFSVRVDHGFGVVSDLVRVRVFGVQAPEMKGVSRRAGIVARDAVRDWFSANGVNVSLQSVSRDKYGRLVARVFSRGGQSLGDWLVARKLAVPFFV